MRRHLNLRVVAVVVALLLVGSACGDGSNDSSTVQDPATTTTEATSPTSEEPSPTTHSDSVEVAWSHDWTEKTVGGGQFDAGDYAGQDLVLWFWAPW